MLIEAADLAPRAQMLAGECWRLRNAFAAAGVAGSVAPTYNDTLRALTAAQFLAEQLVECAAASAASK